MGAERVSRWWSPTRAQHEPRPDIDELPWVLYSSGTYTFGTATAMMGHVRDFAREVDQNGNHGLFGARHIAWCHRADDRWLRWRDSSRTAEDILLDCAEAASWLTREKIPSSLKAGAKLKTKRSKP